MLKKVFHFIVSKYIIFLVFWVLVLSVSIVALPHVRVNYDATTYLPEDMNTVQALDAMKEEFGLTGQASLMIEEVTIQEAMSYKERIKQIDGVLDVMWIDTFIEKDAINTLLDTARENDIHLENMDVPGLNQFYKEKTALFQVIFEESDYSLLTGSAIEEIRNYFEIVNKPFAMSGTAISAYYTRTLTQSEVFKITLYVIPIILFILVLFTTSWMEPLLFLIVVGVSVVVNMGSNYFFTNISFITNSTASLLQLAIAMDYSIFLLHKYSKYKKEGYEVRQALGKAMQESFLSVSASMLTTAAGFVALMFMRYSLGFDMAIVMIKGILLSLICAFTLLPALILMFHKQIESLEHKPYFPKLDGFAKKVFQTKFIIVALVLLILIPTFNAQGNNHFLYGDSAMSASEGTLPYEESKRIETTFGKNNPLVILIPKETPEEATLIEELKVELGAANIGFQIQALSTLSNIETYIEDLPQAIQDAIRPMVPQNWINDQIPENLKNQLVGDTYARIILTMETDTESEEAFRGVEIVNYVVPRHFALNEYYILGSSNSVKEIKEVVESDYQVVNIMTIALVALILLFTFKSIMLPLLLVLVIQISVWINMSIPYFTDNSLIFIGYLIVSAVQLGATIDYGILMTNSYLEYRKTNEKKEAIKEAIKSSGNSILTSAFILCSAGYALKFVSSIEGVASLGELIGRGAFLSGFFVLTLLPQSLYFLDTFIAKTTYKVAFYKPETEAKDV